MEDTQHYTKNTESKWLIRKAFINDTILCVFHRQYKTIISALFVPNDNCSNEPGATYIEPGALGRLILGLGRIHKLSQNNLSVTFTYIVILFVIHCQLSPICNRHPAPSSSLSFSHTAWACRSFDKIRLFIRASHQHFRD